MSLLEGRTIQKATEEVKLKFWPSYQVSTLIFNSIYDQIHLLFAHRLEFAFGHFFRLLTFILYLNAIEFHMSVCVV